MKNIYFWTCFLKTIISLLIIGIIITYFNLDNNIIKIIKTKTITTPIYNNTGIDDIFKENQYIITTNHIDIIINYNNVEKKTQPIKVKRYTYKDDISTEMYKHFKMYDNLLKASIVLTFVLFIAVFLSFYVPTKNTIKRLQQLSKQTSLHSKYKLSIYIIMVIIFIPLFIMFMILINKDIRNSMKTLPLLKPICLDSNNVEFGLCKKYDYQIDHLDSNLLKNYDYFDFSNNLKTSFVSYEWKDGSISRKLISCIIQIIALYVTTLVLIVFEFSSKIIKKRNNNNPYITRN